MENFSATDWFALAWLAGHILLYAWLVDWGPWRVYSLSTHMAKARRDWITAITTRELRMMDIQIVSGLQSGTAFFASSSLLAIGAAFTLLTSGQEFQDLGGIMGLPISNAPTEPKALLLLAFYGYAFFKFGWAYRLFNYSSILLGAIPQAGTASEAEVTLRVERAIRLNILAASQFTRGLRSFFISVSALFWFAGPLAMVIATTFITIVLINRQFASPPRQVLLLDRDRS